MGVHELHTSGCIFARQHWMLLSSCLLGAVLLLDFSTNRGWAQNPDEQTAQPRYIQSAAASGTRVIRPDTWSMLSFEVANPTQHDVSVLAASYFEKQSSLQFGKQIWIPENAKRRSFYPIRPPASPEQDGNIVNVYSLLMDRTDAADTDKLIFSQTDQMHYHSLLSATKERPTTALFDDTDDENVRQTVAAGRTSRNLTVVVFDLRENSLPPDARWLDGLDQIVIANNTLLTNGRALSAVRRWLTEGGRVWLMLDKIQPELLDSLIGDRIGWAPHDHILLDTITITDDRPVSKDQKREFSATYTNPVRMVRGVMDGMQVTQSVNGWPAAAWCNVGNGELLLTTLEARGWYRSWTPEDTPNPDFRKRSNHAASESLQMIAERFFVPRNSDVPAAKAFTISAAGEIGQTILPRRFVALTLGSLCVGLVVMSLVCIRLDRTAVLGWLGPLAALVVAFVLCMAGSGSRTAIGRSLAVGQWIEADDTFSEIRTSGALAIYNPQQWNQPLGSEVGGMFLPQGINTTGTSVRMIWTDSDHWSIENMDMESGLHLAPFSFSTSLQSAVRAQATFGPDGLTGSLETGPCDEVSDLILITPHRAPIRVRLGENGQFEARSSDILSPGQFTDSAIVSDDQQRRRQVLEALFDPEDGWNPSARATLLAWTKPLDLPFQLNDPDHSSGSALLSVPVRLYRPEAGSRVSIPTVMNSFRVVPAADGTMSSAYSNTQQKWVGELSAATHAKLRVQIPSEVVPLQLESLNVKISLKAPQRLLQFVGHQDAKDLVLGEKQSPVGTLELELPANEFLQVDQEGGILLTLKIGPHPNEASGNIAEVGWKIDDLSFGVKGVVQAP